MPKRYPPDSPREWMNRAFSDLTLANAQGENVYLEDLCFHVQQAVEKSIKALLIQQKVKYPYTHDIGQLLTASEVSGLPIPQTIRRAERLTMFAVITRCPGVSPSIQPFFI